MHFEDQSTGGLGNTKIVLGYVQRRCAVSMFTGQRNNCYLRTVEGVTES